MIDITDFLFGMLCGVGLIFIWECFQAWWKDMHD